MREIKFRAWHPENEVMVYFDNQKASRDQYISGALSKLMAESSPLLMQKAGIKDKNGVEIYEGDIVRLRGGTMVEVVFENACIGRDDWGLEHKTPCFCGKFDDDSGYTGLDELGEVIGNIHEGESK